MERLFQLVDRYCFQGHTHVPGVFTEGFQFYAPEEIDNEYTLGEGKLMVNVGSVGQPRDGDNRACYAVLEDDQVTWHRVAYDFQATAEKILRTGVLSEVLARRLALGK
jgi:diadenosine tetraphosphatase ApaH/serine/threonine PP2A family protein phosphatase